MDTTGRHVSSAPFFFLTSKNINREHKLERERGCGLRGVVLEPIVGGGTAKADVLCRGGGSVLHR